MHSQTRALILANPTAGIGAGRINKQRLIDVARRDLERDGLQVEVTSASESKELSDLAERAVLNKFDYVIAAGGDGTINSVVNGMMRTARPPRALSSEEDLRRQSPRVEGTALGVLPMGTGNVFAFNLGIANSWREACKVIRHGHTRRIDVGLACALAKGFKATDAPRKIYKSRHFLLMSGVGFDAKVVEDTSLRLKFVLRDFAYVIKSLQNVVLHQGTQVTLTFHNGAVHTAESWLIMIGNAASYAWDIRFTSQARLDDGYLDICLMPFENKLVSIQQILQILTGQHVERGIARYWKTQGVRIESDPPVPVQLDGDEWARTPIEVSLLPGALHVLAPEQTES
jgi:diacylglycerol kinase (ATP)